MLWEGSYAELPYQAADLLRCGLNLATALQIGRVFRRPSEQLRPVHEYGQLVIDGMQDFVRGHLRVTGNYDVTL